ncbi:unnamed protein product [Lactuca saligna]|uniref:Uncharacterized protein n=1 Tax=Lactuca saligna TaxID=75948 RepID=A0AA35V304_LACSI|nr:unnamed protein product [Lactuca saligna]
MLQRIDFPNPILVLYLASFNTTISVGVLFPKGVKGSLKVIKAQKKEKQTEESKPIQEHAEEEVSKEIQNLGDVAKECHELLVDHVKNMKEIVDIKMVELKSEIAKEVEKIEKSYYVIHGKVDVIFDTIAKLVEYNNFYSKKLDEKTEKDSQIFANLEFLNSIKESISQANHKAELAPILELILLLPTNAPTAKHVSQGGEKGCGGIGSLKDTNKGAVVGKVMSTQILTSLSISLTTTSTTTTTRPISKGIVISESDGGSGACSMPPTSRDNQGYKGKGVLVTPSEEEKKKQQALEIKRQR